MACEAGDDPAKFACISSGYGQASVPFCREGGDRDYLPRKQGFGRGKAQVQKLRGAHGHADVEEKYVDKPNTL